MENFEFKGKHMGDPCEEETTSAVAGGSSEGTEEGEPHDPHVLDHRDEQYMHVPHNNNCITVCSEQNLEAKGIHTADSSESSSRSIKELYEAQQEAERNLMSAVSEWCTEHGHPASQIEHFAAA
eukprot:1540949-Lingulodinium_polyedra.AAC.1